MGPADDGTWSVLKTSACSAPLLCALSLCACDMPGGAAGPAYMQYSSQKELEQQGSKNIMI